MLFIDNTVCENRFIVNESNHLRMREFNHLCCEIENKYKLSMIDITKARKTTSLIRLLLAAFVCIYTFTLFVLK